jgi:hypothetical protein
VYLPFNLLWLFAPLVLGWRVLRGGLGQDTTCD